jgi:hypothetical protein
MKTPVSEKSAVFLFREVFRKNLIYPSSHSSVLKMEVDTSEPLILVS